MTSVLILIMCALLGYGYMIQINNADATYETLSEDELTRLIQRDRHTGAEPGAAQVGADQSAGIAQGRGEQDARRSASPSRTRRPTASSPVVCPRRARACRSASTRSKTKIDAATMPRNSSRNCGCRIAEVMAINHGVIKTYVSDTDDGLETSGTLNITVSNMAIGDCPEPQNTI